MQDDGIPPIIAVLASVGVIIGIVVAMAAITWALVLVSA